MKAQKSAEENLSRVFVGKMSEFVEDSCETECDGSCESESGASWESEPETNDALYIPTPEHHGKVCPMNLPNKLGVIALPQVRRYLEMVNNIWGCKTPGSWVHRKFSSRFCGQPRVGWQLFHHLLL